MFTVNTLRAVPSGILQKMGQWGKILMTRTWLIISPEGGGVGAGLVIRGRVELILLSTL